MLWYVLLGKAVNLPGKFYKLSRKVLWSPMSIDRRLVIVLWFGTSPMIFWGESLAITQTQHVWLHVTHPSYVGIHTLWTWVRLLSPKLEDNSLHENLRTYCTFDINWQPGPWILRFFVAPSKTIIAVQKIRSPTWGMVRRWLLAKICFVVNYLPKSTFT